MQKQLLTQTGHFDVDKITDITWNDKAFEMLVLPPDEKALAWAFVESKNLSNPGFFDDFVADKGRGLIMLLCGAPGVGKTFTAEAIAEKARVPLYFMSAGELGSVPSRVEVALDKALELCKKWKAMLLLDEADVFLGKRNENSIERNELVSSGFPPSPSPFFPRHTSMRPLSLLMILTRG